MSVLKIRNATDTGWITIGGGVEVIQQDSEPASPFAGMLWLDTDQVGVGGSVSAPTVLDNTDDLNTLTNYGWYCWDDSNPANVPSNSTFNDYGVLLYTYDPSQDWQMVWMEVGERRGHWCRRKDSGTWGNWKLVGGSVDGALTTLSGTTTNLITDMPAGVTKFEVLFNAASDDGTDIGVQLGDSGGFETTGYWSTSRDGSLRGSVTTMFGTIMGSGWGAANELMGIYKFRRWDDGLHLWLADGIFWSDISTERMAFSGGHKTLSGELTQVRIVSGTIDSGIARVRITG
jgi:hypothetical protein